MWLARKISTITLFQCVCINFTAIISHISSVIAIDEDQMLEMGTFHSQSNKQHYSPLYSEFGFIFKETDYLHAEYIWRNSIEYRKFI